MKKYEELRAQYPDYISLDMLYRICRISKRSASYLVQHKVIPAIDTGKRTWRYRIALDDVIAYLQKRDKQGSMIPRGAASSNRNYQTGLRVSFSSVIKQGEEREVRNYFAYIYADFPDVLGKSDVVEMTGLCEKTILSLLKSGSLQSIVRSRQYLIPKEYLLDFVTTPSYLDCKSNSVNFKKIIGGFELWKTAKS